MTVAIRALLTLGLFAIVAFCVFGFLASFEYSEPARRLPWQIGYGIAGVICLFCVVRLWRGRR